MTTQRLITLSLRCAWRRGVDPTNDVTTAGRYWTMLFRLHGARLIGA